MEQIVDEKPKRPTFLVVLVILSAISMILSFISTVGALISGPMDSDTMEMYNADVYESLSVLRDSGAHSMADIVENFIHLAAYENNEIFYTNHLITLFIIIIGIVGITLMFQLRKLGFHLYIIYSILPILSMYILLPMELIPSFLVIGSLLISLLFIVLYGLNLKHMK